jgi:hypothetical protein
MRIQIIVRQPTGSVDTVQDIVGDLKCKIQTAAVVLHPASERQVISTGSGGELGNPIFYAGELHRVGILTGGDYAIEFRGGPTPGIERAGEFAREETCCARQKSREAH